MAGKNFPIYGQEARDWRGVVTVWYHSKMCPTMA
jgi:hypothetical protein